VLRSAEAPDHGGIRGAGTPGQSAGTVGTKFGTKFEGRDFPGDACSGCGLPEHYVRPGYGTDTRSPKLRSRRVSAVTRIVTERWPQIS